jgi:hypothetical protein
VAENSARAAKRRKAGGRPFVKGQSGNPGGRPKIIGHVRELARKHTKGALNTLVTIAEDVTAPQSARVSAATALLDRGWGKPSQPLDGDGEGGPIGLSVAVKWGKG